MNHELTFPRRRFVSLGALADRDLGTANAALNALFPRTSSVQRALIEAQRQGFELDPDLVQAIEGLSTEIDGLAQRVNELNPSELPVWLVATRQYEQDLAYLEQQLEEATGAAATRQLGYLIGGGVLVAAALTALVYYSKKRRGS